MTRFEKKISALIAKCELNIAKSAEISYGHAMLDHLSSVSRVRHALDCREEINKEHMDRIWSYAKLIYHNSPKLKIGKFTQSWTS